jgi:polyhydroxyalkanoate synthesis regulator phasin
MKFKRVTKTYSVPGSMTSFVQDVISDVNNLSYHIESLYAKIDELENRLRNLESDHVRM